MSAIACSARDSSGRMRINGGEDKNEH